MSADLAQVSVVIPSWNTRELLAECLTSLAAARAAGAEVIVVDDASTDGSAEHVARHFEGVLLEARSVNAGFAPSVNVGARRATRPYLFLLNADTRVHAGALEALLAFLDTHPGYAAVAPRLVHPSGETQRACMAFPRLRTALFHGTPLERWLPNSAELERYFLRDFDHERDADVEQPPAAALLLRREPFLATGALDEALPVFFNDVDLCKRIAAAGEGIRFLAAAEVTHHVGASTRQLPSFAVTWHTDRLAYYRKHHGRLAGVWVKACSGLTWADHLLGGLARRIRGRPGAPIGPLWRAFGSFLLR